MSPVATHTPGPWRVSSLQQEIEIVGRPTWKCRRNGIPGEWTVARVTDLVALFDEAALAPYVEMQANAHLIATAPELLQQLRIAVGHIDHMAAWISRINAGEARGTYSFESLGEDIEDIRAAIRQAVGGQK